MYIIFRNSQAMSQTALFCKLLKQERAWDPAAVQYFADLVEKYNVPAISSERLSQDGGLKVWSFAAPWKQ